ncbi:Uncharacterised protein [Actinobacillus ureae]|uniref:Uncharacterized protein n=1 Tax=Actinobacillus ureae ATCC 25976 TaxID=887324 RepID=E8KEI7_9PAST|nr:hypothetical protein [Actinobacillus ureae]EFX92679.1 hypothetical protein HMPREF0027_0254 [Actinobacillus ureae ATCC 25976]SUT88151.1 Uncharacterised protein [Actinobacillus ureae]SUU49997.1 Uncharacterised protein [Actinobacillus ureae]
MLTFLKEHRWCFTFLLFFIGTIIYTYLWYKDVADHRYYPIALSERDEITIDYQTPYIVSDKRCFKLGFSVKEAEDYYEHYDKLYRPIYDLPKKEFYSKVADRPKLRIKIFKDTTLVRQDDLYVDAIYGHGDRIINGKKYWLIDTYLYSEYEKDDCHYFEPQSSYKIVVTNFIPKEYYKNIEVFFGIFPIKPR